MNPHLVLITLAMWVGSKGFGQNGVDFILPAGSRTQDGDTYSVYPVFPQPNTIRYQQVYAASEFTSLTNFGGGWVINIHFRGDATNGTSLGVTLPSVQVNLSATQRGPDQLSPLFADNIGADDTVVYSGDLQTSISGGHGDGPEAFTFWIHLSKLYFYNPAAGNLLLDIRIFQGNTNTNGMIEARFDACNVANDSVSRVIGGTVNATTGSIDTVGLVTDFNVWRNPTLSVQLQTNSLVLTWPANPPGVGVLPDTVLQTNRDFAAPFQWKPVTNGILTSSLVNTFTIPLEAAGTQAYFRLLSTAP